MKSIFRSKMFLPALVLALVLAGCSADDPQPAASIAAVPRPETAPPVPTIPADQATFAFDPFIGAPGNIADDLSRKIGSAARQENLTIVRRSDTKATYRVTGYLNAVGDNTGTVLVYVYDIYDAANRRVHRVTGQESSGGSAGDPWAGISGSALQNVATRTVDSLKTWITSVSP